MACFQVITGHSKKKLQCKSEIFLKMSLDNLKYVDWRPVALNRVNQLISQTDDCFHRNKERIITKASGVPRNV